MVTGIKINIKSKIFKASSSKTKSHSAIKKLNLNVSKGEFCSIIGPSGCGKTTLLNLISGLDKNLNGNIIFDKNKKVADIKIAYMFQNPRLLPWLTVLENVEIVLSKEQKASNRAKDILSIMGLKKFLNYYPDQLSGGMQRRVALARSYSSQPELFLLDEPFVSLDDQMANKLRDMLINLWTKEPTTIIFVTHDLREAIYLADRIIFLSPAPSKVLMDKKINNIKKYYGSFLALNNISLELKTKELVVLLGPNGAGKSTLFSIITGLARADSGECFINSNNVASNSIGALKSLGVVFQQPTIDLELTVKENLLFHARLHGLRTSNLNKTIEKELEDSGLEKKINNKVRTLSGGERRKVELIRSLLHSPNMLLLDEPTVGLDPGSRADLLNKIMYLKSSKNLSVLWTTHLVDEAEKADKIIILNKGRVIAIGSNKEILNLAKENSLAKAFLKLVKEK